jgi:uncharacterized protein YciI
VSNMSSSDHHLLLYTYVPDIAQRRGPHRQGHLDRIQAQKDAGKVVMAGAFGDPILGGAIAWRGASRDEIEAFVRDDPYQAAGLIAEYRIEPYMIV